VAGLLGGFGYEESAAVQTPEVLNGIKLMMSVFPTITFMIGFACLFFYTIDKKTEVQLEKELSERRKADSK
jgi:Na+/melibiose symporter-like transporter